MRVLHLGKYFAPVSGGIERFLGDLVPVQRARGRDATVLVHGGQSETSEFSRPWLTRCKVQFRLFFAPISLGYPLCLKALLGIDRPAFLHIHMPNPSAFWVLALPSARALPWVVHWHSDVEPSKFSLGLRLAYPHYRIFEYALLDRASAVIVTSPQYLESSKALAPWRDKCRVIPLGADPARLPALAESAVDGLWRSDGTRLLAIGRLTYYKGFETLIEAVATEQNMELLIVGEGECRPTLEALLRRRGNPPWIRLLGQADDATVCGLLASCDVFCLPSRERTEAFGIVLMEAMRYGKPVVASRIEGSGVLWVVREGENGLLVSIGDVGMWRDTLRTLSLDPELRRRLGEAGRRRFQAEMTIDQVEARIDELYRDVLAEDMPSKSTLNRILVIIPALNEAATVAEVVSKVRERNVGDVVVVDDGSSDGTAEIAAAAGALVLSAPLSQGAWGAMQMGIRYAVRRGYRGVVTMDADGQHEPAYLDALLRAAETADVVIGACPERGSRMRHLAWAYFRMLTGLGLSDLTSGFRYYGNSACQLLAGEEATLLDYQDIGVLLLLRRAGFRIAEIPVAMNPRKAGMSRVFNSWATVIRYMAETTLLCLARWGTRSRPV